MTVGIAGWWCKILLQGIRARRRGFVRASRTRRCAIMELLGVVGNIAITSSGVRNHTSAASSKARQMERAARREATGAVTGVQEINLDPRKKTTSLLHSGFLEKKMGFRQVWAKRWFTLNTTKNGAELRVWEPDSDSDEQAGSLKATFDLRAGMIWDKATRRMTSTVTVGPLPGTALPGTIACRQCGVRMTYVDVADHACGPSPAPGRLEIEIQSTVEGWRLRAGSEAERDEWVQQIQRAAAPPQTKANKARDAQLAVMNTKLFSAQRRLAWSTTVMMAFSPAFADLLPLELLEKVARLIDTPSVVTAAATKKAGERVPSADLEGDPAVRPTAEEGEPPVLSGSTAIDPTMHARRTGPAARLSLTLFDLIDADKSNQLEGDEIRAFLMLGGCDEHELDLYHEKAVFVADANGDGIIDRDEFIDWALSDVELDEGGNFEDKDAEREMIASIEKLQAKEGAAEEVITLARTTSERARDEAMKTAKQPEPEKDTC